MISEPSLLIAAPLADDFDLAHLPWCEPARAKLSVNRAKFRDLDMVEVIFDAMTFRLARLTMAETRQLFAATTDQSHLPGGLSSTESAISVALTASLTSAGHLPEVNLRLLLLGKWIGESLDATAVAWIPTRTAMSFVDFRHYFAEALAEGEMPYPDV